MAKSLAPSLLVLGVFLLFSQVISAADVRAPSPPPRCCPCNRHYLPHTKLTLFFFFLGIQICTVTDIVRGDTYDLSSLTKTSGYPIPLFLFFFFFSFLFFLGWNFPPLSPHTGILGKTGRW